MTKRREICTNKCRLTNSERRSAKARRRGFPRKRLPRALPDSGATSWSGKSGNRRSCTFSARSKTSPSSFSALRSRSPSISRSQCTPRTSPSRSSLRLSSCSMSCSPCASRSRRKNPSNRSGSIRFRHVRSCAAARRKKSTPSCSSRVIFSCSASATACLRTRAFSKRRG